MVPSVAKVPAPPPPEDESVEELVLSVSEVSVLSSVIEMIGEFATFFVPAGVAVALESMLDEALISTLFSSSTGIEGVRGVNTALEEPSIQESKYPPPR